VTEGSKSGVLFGFKHSGLRGQYQYCGISLRKTAHHIFDKMRMSRRVHEGHVEVIYFERSNFQVNSSLTIAFRFIGVKSPGETAFELSVITSLFFQSLKIIFRDIVGKFEKMAQSGRFSNP